MRLLLLHLSDIHVSNSDDPVFNRAEDIVKAVQNLDYRLDLCTIVVSGDIAYSGTDEELMEGWSFLGTIREGLQKKLSHGNGQSRSVPVEFVVVPGNHDCDFSGAQVARHRIADQIIDNPKDAKDDSVVEVCTGVQNNFFEFRNLFAKRGLVKSTTTYDSRLYYEYVFDDCCDKRLRFRCCNTAWLSRREEKQGQLYYPPEAVPVTERVGESNDDALVVTVFHHPYNWLEADHAREFRKRVERVSDVILTGHEHDGDRKIQTGERGEHNEYIEAGPLQESGNASKSFFNAIVIDTSREKQKFLRFGWEDGIYQPVGSSGNRDWEPFQVNQLREHQQFRINAEMKEFLDDLGINVQHPKVRDIGLSDIFVYPDLRKLNFEEDESNSLIRGEAASDLVLDEEKLLIAGDDWTSKTSLAKKLFRDLYFAGEVPIYLEGSESFSSKEDRLYDQLERRFIDQYSEDELEAFHQLERDRRAVILDDYDKLKMSPEERLSLLDALERFAGRIVLFANDLFVEVDELAQTGHKSKGVSAFQQLRIEPFGHVRRDELVEKWLMLGSDESVDSVKLARQLTDRRRVLNTVFGRNYVPAYPAYILSVLQAAETAAPVDMRASTHGYFFGILIRAELARDRSQVEYDVISGYLSYLAYQLFSIGKREIDEEKFKEIHREYEKNYDVSRSADKLMKELLEKQVLAETAGLYRFKRNYFYYYFVASYMCDHITKGEVREHIAEMSRHLYAEENSDILLFLAHLSKHPFIVEEMLNAAGEIFPDQTPVMLGEDVSFFDDLREEVAEVVYKERDPREVRKEVLEARDELEEASNSEKQSDLGTTEPKEFEDEIGDPTKRFSVALRTLNILGQILKNFPGTLESEPKLDIAESCYRLGLRALSFYYDLLKDSREQIIEDIADAMREKDPSIDVIELRERAKKAVSGLFQLLAFGMIKRIAHSVGSAELSKTYDRLKEKWDTPAVKLVDASLALDYTRKAPHSRAIQLAEEFEDKPLPLSVLRYLVVQYFYLFPVDDFQVKQRVCQALDISYSRVQGADPSRKRIKGN
ncbi:MAG: hypothetical protein GVY12_16985 [Bacteroidetes bacterium]|nr:hypothetical protein [Bacteroidota bacterium]